MRKGQSNLPKRGVNIVEGGANHVVTHAPDQQLAASAAEVRPPDQLYNHRSRMNLQPGVTFGELCQLLARHGFEQIPATGTHRAFKESRSGALVILPAYQDREELRPFHLASVRKLLVEHGFVK